MFIRFYFILRKYIIYAEKYHGNEVGKVSHNILTTISFCTSPKWRFNSKLFQNLGRIRRFHCSTGFYFISVIPLFHLATLRGFCMTYRENKNHQILSNRVEQKTNFWRRSCPRGLITIMHEIQKGTFKKDSGLLWIVLLQEMEYYTVKEVFFCGCTKLFSPYITP